MALTKNVIAEPTQTGLGFSKNKSVEGIESLLKIVKLSLAAGDALLFEERLKKAVFLLVTA